ncbi:MAG: ornithine--oxo-acid transaminase [Candidatus Brocadiia bacterium]
MSSSGEKKYTSKYCIEVAEKYGAHNYHPLPIVISRAESVWVWDPEGKKYMDMLSSYSALNQGHRHRRIIAALKEQADRVTLTSRAFHNDRIGPFEEKLAKISKKDKVLLMNSGAEAVETALKAARKWGHKVKGVPENKAEIICCENNFHGRTITIVGFSTEAQYRDGFGPFTPGFSIIKYGCPMSLEAAINENTVAFLVEPIQGEAGIIVPPEGYLRAARDICTRNNILLITDEIQTGFGRTGKMFCCEWDGIEPDMYIVGKALGGGVFPVSAIMCNDNIMKVFTPGDHGSTFGGNPLACAVGDAALSVLVDEKLAERSLEMGEYFMGKLRGLNSPVVKEIRGRGLLIGVEIKVECGVARPYCEKLLSLGILAKETHHQVIRFAPPLVITKEEIDWAMERIAKVLL